jgi:thiamine biosynthesis lipoprotein ApbE/Na+-translocating ferredoxin:NAD+ oxidoreductase RnfG subunit
MILTKPRLLQLYRLSVLGAVVGMLQAQLPPGGEDPATPPPLETVRRWFPEVGSLGPVISPRQAWPVLGGDGQRLGQVLRTAPSTDGIIGYAGPSDLLIAEELDGAVRGVSILSSGDTPDHTALVEQDSHFATALTGWQPANQPMPRVEAVSGSTLTSLAMAEAVARRLEANPVSLRFPEPVTMEEVRSLFPAAASWDGREASDASGKLLGLVLRTAPASDQVRGHAGPTESLIALEPDGVTVREVRLRKSYDTADYTDQVRDDRFYLAGFAGRTLEQLAAMDYSRQGIEGVSGATETSYAVAEGLKRWAAMELAAKPSPQPFPWKWRDTLQALVLLGALLMAFTPLRGKPWVRRGWQAVLMGYVGLVSHDLLSLGLLTGWATHGPAWRHAPGLVLLGAAALLIPWATGRQLYCHQICPHGAAQLWLGRLTQRKISVPRKLGSWLERMPGVLLLIALAAAFHLIPVEVAHLEPFDAWAWRAAGVGVLLLAAAGLLVSVWIPQAYCRYGCPTGALLKWVRTAGPADRFSRRDALALACVMAAAGWGYVSRNNPPTAAARVAEAPVGFRHVSGRTMGTTWSLKVRHSALDAANCQQGIQAGLDRVENLLSTWRNDTPVARFNQAATTERQPLPDEIMQLLRHGQQLSQLTGGAYDLTVGPLVRAWGYGPPPRPAKPPGADQIRAILPLTGWDKLTLFPTGAARAHPGLEIDLTSLAEGWALDEAARWLAGQGISDYLLEVGGELRSAGDWPVAVELPAESLRLKSRSLSTSGTYRQCRPGREPNCHLIDPRTGYPVPHHTVAVSVLAADSLTADSWATALNVLGVAEGLLLANRLGLSARFVTEEAQGHLRITRSDAWEEGKRERPLISYGPGRE